MTKAKKLTRLMSDGKPRSVDMVAKEMNLTRKEAVAAVQHLRKQGYANVEPVAYVITDAGRKHAASKSFDELPIYEQRARRKERDYRASLKAGREVEAPVISIDTVKSAIQSRPPLQQMWGAL